MLTKCADCGSVFVEHCEGHNVCTPCFQLQFPGITCQAEWDAYWADDSEQLWWDDYYRPRVSSAGLEEVFPEEWDAAFAHLNGPLPEPEPLACQTCGSRGVKLDHTHGMCEVCWDALTGRPMADTPGGVTWVEIALVTSLVAHVITIASLLLR